MTKSDLILRLAKKYPHLQAKHIEDIANVVLGTVTDALARGDRVELRGFGAFSVKRRDARRGRNPHTGQAVEVGERYTPFFRAGKQLRDDLNRPPASPQRRVAVGEKGARRTST